MTAPDRPLLLDPGHVHGPSRVQTGIPGFDHVTMGGLPRGRATLVTGAAGSAKTVMAVQFLAEGVKRGQLGVFVTFEESADDIRENMRSLGWDIAGWERDGLWRFVDASPVTIDEAVVGGYDLAALIARVGHALDQTAAERISLDSISAILAQFEDRSLIRQQLHRLIVRLRRLGLTVLLTVEAPEDGHALSRFTVEEFVADNVVILRNNLEEEKRRRTVEVLKMRGAMHRKGEYPFTVLPGQGIIVIPLSVMELTQQSTDTRVTSGNADLDAMCSGGFFRDSIVLASGATGTGKTLLVTEFMDGGVQRGERCLLFAFEESRDQMFRNAQGWGRDFQAAEASGQLRLYAAYPEVASLEDHLVAIKEAMDEFQPDRIAVDSLSALERIGTRKSFREFLIGLTSFVKQKQVAALFTATSASLLGGSSITEGHVSTLTDSIILLRYVEMYGEVKRGLTVLKMRGSMHEKEIREFRIDGEGLHIGRPFRTVGGILSGRVVSAPMPERDRLHELFRDDEDPARAT
ncbi:MAG: circadian clock protein KaiC [Frankiaceae bacterium]